MFFDLYFRRICIYCLVLLFLENVSSLPDVTAFLYKSACAGLNFLWYGFLPCRRRGR